MRFTAALAAFAASLALAPRAFADAPASAPPAASAGATDADGAKAPAGSDAGADQLDGPRDGATTSDAKAADADRWCAPELESLSNDVCTFASSHPSSGPRTLVIFLHGVTQPGSGWQWTFQRGAARIAEARGLTVIMPRGRRGHGPKGMEDWWTWPTSQKAQQAIEAEILAEWAGAERELETKLGQKFERVWVFGFSNGAYYATSLAMRGRLAADGDPNHPVADGYAAFAGGSGASYLKAAGKVTKDRPPFFVGWGGKDPKHGDQQELAEMLKDLRWPSKSEGAKKAGHTATDRQLTDAVAFLGGRESSATSEAAADSDAAEGDKPASHPKKTASKSKSKKKKKQKKKKKKTPTKPSKKSAK
jgi:predicted esterase